MQKNSSKEREKCSLQFEPTFIIVQCMRQLQDFSKELRSRSPQIGNTFHDLNFIISHANRQCLFDIKTL